MSRPHPAPQSAVFDPTAPARTGAAATPLRSRTTSTFADTALKATAATWFAVAVIGQLFFVTYVLGFYGAAAARGDVKAWNQVLTHGWIDGDPIGNVVVAVHLAVAVFVILGGLLQLVPAIRRHAPRLHRWNGRVYLATVCVMAISGLTMIWTRGAAGALSQDIAISINALLILAFAALAYRDARARRFDAHRRWALRLFLVVSGVWFFRLMLPLWILVNQGPAGFDPETFQGPAITAISFLDYLLPLAVLEFYLRAQRGGARAKLAMAGGLGVCTLLTAAGTFAAAMILWLPKL